MTHASKVAEMVREMHEHLGAHINYGPPSTDIPDDLREIRIALLDEEVREYRDAARAGDLVGIADGLADLVYVAYGTAHTYGIPLDDVLAEVHRSNMTKRPNPDGGKFIKGSDFSPADVAGVLNGHPREHVCPRCGEGADDVATDYVACLCGKVYRAQGATEAERIEELCSMLERSGGVASAKAIRNVLAGRPSYYT